MKLLLAALLLTGCGATSEPAGAVSSHRIGDVLGASVCSATAVASRTLLSAAHCFEGNPTAITIDGKVYGVLHIELDHRDHALVRVTKVFTDYAKRGPEQKVGDKVHWVGQPMGLANVYGEGVVAGEYQGRTLYDANWWFGVSGGGIFNERGELVGVVSGILTQNIYKLGWAWPLAFTAEQWESIK